jgi:aryl-alcohol dehydrogenase-like predicted oxidoreductase
MNKRRLGATGMVSSAIGLGCLGFTGAYGQTDRSRSIMAVRAALDAGITILAVADFYRGGAVERLVGEALGPSRSRMFIATQGGVRFSESGRPTGVDASPAYLRRACDASLRRLRTDLINVYFLARPDHKVPIEDSVGALAELVAKGKVGGIGLCDVSVAMLRRAHAIHPVTAVAAEYSLWHRRPEQDILPAARELAVAFIACRPLGRGFLAGQVTSASQLGADDERRGDQRFTEANLARARPRLQRAQEMAALRNVGVGRLVLAWLLAQGDHVVPVPGTRSSIHAEMNAAATRVAISTDECEELSALFPANAGAADYQRR